MYITGDLAFAQSSINIYFAALLNVITLRYQEEEKEAKVRTQRTAVCKVRGNGPGPTSFKASQVIYKEEEKKPKQTNERMGKLKKKVFVVV